MLLNQLYKALIVSVAVVAVSGCTSMGKKAGDAGDSASASGAADGSLSGSGLTDEQLRAKTVFYFDYDSATVNAADQEALAAHARYLSANPGKSARLSGHADERGTREYNMALGERRAKAASEILAVNGAPNCEVVSYGEEQPAAAGHDESAWAQNRRVELAYK